MTAIPGSIRVTGMIAPSDSTDVYATHDSKYEKGGFKEVQDYTERDGISNDRRSEGMLVYVNATKEYFILKNNIFTLLSFNAGTSLGLPLPSMRMNDYNHENFLAYLAPIHKENINILPTINAFSHLISPTPVARKYNAMIYSPSQDSIHLLPEVAYSSWECINCSTGLIVSYPHKITCGTNYYVGGVFTPTLNRIYLVPGLIGNVDWHYIDCNYNVTTYAFATSPVKSYSHTGITITTSDIAYSGGVYSPKQDKIYFMPADQARFSTWHYIDCIDGTVHEYNNPFTFDYHAYNGGIYSPTNDRIYLLPDAISSSPTWHYIDCATGTVVAYDHLADILPRSSAYNGGAYSPTENKIYLAPCRLSDESIWHFIDCENSTLVGYTGDANCVDQGYAGAVYSPTVNRIYFTPYNQASSTTPNRVLHYIDCNTGRLLSYLNTINGNNQWYKGGIYSPNQNRVYFTPYLAAANLKWHYIQEQSIACIAPAVAAYPMFNKS